MAQNKAKKILHLTLERKWFEQIRDEIKTIEYREIKPYWTKRLLNEDGTPKKFDEIHFRNGYNKGSPFMRVESKMLGTCFFDGKMCFALFLGKILEVKYANY